MNKPAKKTPDWHQAAAAELNKDFAEINALEMTARKRRVYLGLKFLYIKERGRADGTIPHGHFEPWMKRNCPVIPDRTADRYMSEARSVCERMGWQNRQIGGFEIPPHNLLLAEPSDLKPKQKETQQLLLDLVSGEGKFQPVTEYKQVKKGDDLGESSSQRGRAKGSTGCTKEQRAAAAEREQQEIINERKLKAVEIAEWLTEMSDEKGLGEIFGTPELIQLDLAMETARGFIRYGGPVKGGAQ